jgi:hypothetical protein
MFQTKKFQILQSLPAPVYFANITITEVDTAIPEFWANVALGALKANTVMTQLVNRDYDNLVATRGDQVNIVSRGAISVNDKSANTVITLQNPSNSKISVVLNKHKEVSWLVEDAASAKAISDAIGYVSDAGIKIAEQLDSDLLALYSSLSLNVGAYGTDLSIATILAARQSLNVAKCPQVGRVFVIAPKDDTALLGLAQFTQYMWDTANTVALQEATLGRKYGFTFVMDQQTKATGASPTQTHCLAFVRDAFVMVTRPLPAPPEGSGALYSTIEADGIGVRVLRSYSQKDGGLLWTIDVLYGVLGMRTATHGVEVKT